MVVNLEDFKQDPEKYLAQAIEEEDTVVLKTGLGNYYLVAESEVSGPDQNPMWISEENY